MATLLTGVGYIGAALLRRLVFDRGERVIALDNFYSTSRDALQRILPSSGVELIEGDVADPQAVAQLFDASESPTVLFHLAAQPSAAIAARDPATTERSNLTGARLVLEAAKQRGARVVFGGSFRVYGDELVGQTITEDTPVGRVGDLSHLSKIYVEHLAWMLGLPFASVRLGVAYGLSPVMKTTPAFMTVPNLFCQRGVNGDVLQVVEDRPLAFVHVDDAVKALLLAADQLGDGFEVYNAAPEVATIGQVARCVQRVAHARGRRVRIQGAATSEATFCVGSRLENFTPACTLQVGVEEVFEYFLGLKG